jgi:hypothetical protein
MSAYDLFVSGKELEGKAAVVIDDAGHYEGLAAAEELVKRRFAVTYVTQLPSISPPLHMGGIVEPALSRMYKAGSFAHHTRTRAIAISAASVTLGPEPFWDAGIGEFEVPADVVIFVSVNRSNREIYTTLKENGADVHVVGDANSPRYLQVAIREGHVAGSTV